MATSSRSSSRVKQRRRCRRRVQDPRSRVDRGFLSAERGMGWGFFQAARSSLRKRKELERCGVPWMRVCSRTSSTGRRPKLPRRSRSAQVAEKGISFWIFWLSRRSSRCQSQRGLRIPGRCIHIFRRSCAPFFYHWPGSKRTLRSRKAFGWYGDAAIWG